MDQSTESNLIHTFVRPGHVPTAPYDTRPPSPPSVKIPPAMSGISILPSYDTADPNLLCAEDLRIITMDKVQIANDDNHRWSYNDRRSAQPIFDFLYLGPWGAAKDEKFLREQGITMLFGVVDARMAKLRLMTMDAVSRQLGIATGHVEVADHQELIRVFPEATRQINDHLLDVYRSQALASPAEGQLAIDPATFRRGKVLVFCETGNDRSAAMVAAYIMTVFGVDLTTAAQFIMLRRFCANFDEEAKQWLQSYGDILSARRTVASHRREAAAVPRAEIATPVFKHKRSVNELYSGGSENVGQEGGGSKMDFQNGDASDLDSERFSERTSFVPFVDDEGRRF